MILKRKLNIGRIIFFFFEFCFFSCSLTAKENAPYFINGEFIIEESTEYEIAGLDLYLLNKSEKQISAFTVVFYLFDEDGNPPQGAKNSIVIKVNTEIDSNDYLQNVINLDKYMYEIPEQPYFVDYLYLSEIIYSDGTKWKDPFGQQMF